MLLFKPPTKKHTMKKTNFKAWDQFLIESIDSTEYEMQTPSTPEGKLQFLFNTFHKESGKYLSRVTTKQDQVADWLQGLPGAINIPWEYYRIELLINRFETVKLEGEELEQRQEFYWSFVAMQLLKLARLHKVNIPN